MRDGSGYVIRSIEALEEIYGTPRETSLIKEIDYVSDDYLKLIKASPFLVLASIGPEGLDTSPRGDPAGFVRVSDDRRLLMIPDRQGNNRIDTLRNLVRDPRVSLIFLIPGKGETLRVNGRAEILTHPELLMSFEMQGKPPRSVISVAVERIYFQCQKALARSNLWDPVAVSDSESLPTAGDILKGLQTDFDGSAYDADYPDRMKRTIY